MSEKEGTDFGLEWLLLEAVKFCPIEELKVEKNYPLSFSMTTTQKEEEKDWLENLLHPLIADLIKEELKSSSSEYTILASPLLFETKQSDYCNEVLVIDVSEETQILRTKTRDDVPEEQVKTIILSQINRSERLRLATHIIENENTLDDLKKAVTELHQKIITQIETK